MLTFEQKETVNKVLMHPAFNFTDSTGKQFYDEEKLEVLYQAVELMLQKIDTTHTELPMVDRIETIISEGLPEFPCQFSKYYSNGIDENTKSFPDDRLAGRTAFGLLCTDDGSNCIGFAEATCILLNLKGYEATPIISKLLKGNQTACHYVTGVVDDNGLVRIVDAERKRSCDEPEKQWDLTAYQTNIMYAIPDEDFCKEKIGPQGLGPNFIEFTSRNGKQAIKPIESLRANFPQVLDEQGRLNLSKSAMTPEMKQLLNHVISDSVSMVYQQSLNMGKDLVEARRIA